MLVKYVTQFIAVICDDLRELNILPPISADSLNWRHQWLTLP